MLLQVQRVYSIVLLTLLVSHEALALCRSENYAGTCDEKKNDDECSNACGLDWKGLGRCIWSMSLCLCEACVTFIDLNKTMQQLFQSSFPINGQPPLEGGGAVVDEENKTGCKNHSYILEMIGNTLFSACITLPVHFIYLVFIVAVDPRLYLYEGKTKSWDTGRKCPKLRQWNFLRRTCSFEGP